jgi:hypothetical protein
VGCYRGAVIAWWRGRHDRFLDGLRGAFPAAQSGMVEDTLDHVVRHVIVPHVAPGICGVAQRQDVQPAAHGIG